MQKLIFIVWLILFSIPTSFATHKIKAHTKLALLTPPAAQTPLAAIVPVYGQDKESIIVSKNQPEFTLRLKSNPTTGYSWFLRDYNSSLITPIKHEFEKANQDQTLVGSSGYELWTFKMYPAAFQVPQQTALRFVYMRPWQSSDNGTQWMIYIHTTSN